MNPRRQSKNTEEIRARIEAIWLDHGARLRAGMDSSIKGLAPEAKQAALSRFHDQLYFLLADVDAVFSPGQAAPRGPDRLEGQESFDFGAAPEPRRRSEWVRVPNPEQWDLSPELARTQVKEVMRVDGRLMEAAVVVEERDAPVWTVSGRMVDMEKNKALRRSVRRFKTREGALRHFDRVKKLMEEEGYREQD